MRRIWLTGASSGIGAALAPLLLAQGHRLAVSARNVQPLQALELRYPDQVLVVPGDLREVDQVRAIAQQIADDLRRRRQAEMTRRTRAGGVATALPLGLCFLPAFFLVGIVPTLLGLVGSVLG